MPVTYEYVWIDHYGVLRSKIKYTLLKEDPAVWNFDGSSTGQAVGDNSEVYLKPIATYNHYEHDGLLVLCSTVMYDGTPHPDNTRKPIDTLEDPWFGFELEFFLIDPKTDRPLGVTDKTHMPEQGQFYCSVGAEKCYGRQIIDEHAMACHRAGIRLVGTNAEVACGQWEYQIFGCGIQAADDVWMSRYILSKIAEKHGVTVSWVPKPYNDSNGSGMHTNFSTKRLRDKNTGQAELENFLKRLESNHVEHMKQYGEGNEARMTGKHETASFDKFTWGYANRGASVRVPKTWLIDGCGYIEDRRPASNADPYVIITLLLQTCLD
jgi:glutamine synthetase